MTKHKLFTAIGGIAALAFAVFGVTTVLADAGHDEAPPAENAARAHALSVETAASSDLGSLRASATSWPGEILSTEDVAVHPAREGQIAEWRVRIGDRVVAGQTLARLSAAPATVELASALADGSRALVLSRAQAEATERLVRDAEARLAALKDSLMRSRDAGLTVADAEALLDIESSVGAARELAAAEALRPVRRQAVRSSLERLAFRTSGKLTRDGSSPAGPEAVALMQFRTGIGVHSEAARTAFRDVLAALTEALRDADALPTEEGLDYARALRELLSMSTAAGDVSEEHLADLRSGSAEDEAALIEAMNALADLEKEIIAAGTAARNAQLTAGNAENLKRRSLAEVEVEIAKERAEIDERIADLHRELAMAEAEVRAAEAAYAALSLGAAGRDIVAPRTGVVSAIFRNVGDHVMPDTVVAGITGVSARGRFLRFRVPSDQRPPEPGDVVSVERPGFPFNGKKATVVGVGSSLDDNGFYAADAEFMDPVDWPVHASVRVVADRAGDRVLVPFAAVWWDDDGRPNVWLVMENDVIRPQAVVIGRAVGDRLEIEDGLSPGDRFVSRASDDLEAGASVRPSSERRGDEAPAEDAPDDGHGHSHSHDE